MLSPCELSVSTPSASRAHDEPNDKIEMKRPIEVVNLFILIGFARAMPI